MFKILFLSVLLITVAAQVLSEEEPCDADDVEVKPTEPANSCPKVPNGNCEPGWKNFTRPSGEWCMKVFYENFITYEDANKKCEEIGAKLTGYQNQLEMLYVTYTVVKHIFPESGTVWVGMKRSEACINATLTQNCSGSTSFEWTDGSTSGTEGFHWTPGQPNNMDRLGRRQPCAIMIASPERHVDFYPTGMLDDVSCEPLKNEKYGPRTPKAYVCGKKPKA